MDITIRLRNKLNGQVEEVALPTSLEAVKERFKLDETDDYDNLVIVDSNVDFIDEYDLLEDVLKFSELVEDVDEHLVYACHEFFGYDVRGFFYHLSSTTRDFFRKRFSVTSLRGYCQLFFVKKGYTKVTPY